MGKAANDKGMDARFLGAAAYVLATLLGTAGCPGPNVPGEDAGTAMDARNADVAIGTDAGPSGCSSDTECDDGVDCTTDTCNLASGACRHVVTPALCAVGESCNPTTGCEPGRACGTDGDCADTEACTTNERCDPAARVCTYRVLDGDADGDPPRVCGGGDCDDSTAAVSSLVDEPCAANSSDDDCDGTIDESLGATCPTDLICQDNACVCPSGAAVCGGLCPDYTSDHDHCGACGASCGSGTCTASTCTCTGGMTSCGSAGGPRDCFDTSTSATNCGGCGVPCPATASCVAGSCRCPTGTMLCDGACIDTTADNQNCGRCDRRCGVVGTCTASACTWIPARCVFRGFATCSGENVCLDYDPLNCGTCGTVCSGDCDGGVCR